MQPADLGTVVDLSRGLLSKNRRMAEEHIGYVVKETVKGLLHLHGSGLVHGDVRGSNILITKEGEVKIGDFGFARSKEEASEIFGSPAFLAPEIGAGQTDCDDRVDVWSLGITAIEIGDGKAPYQEMHATRALFQVVRNPPPTLYRPSNWSDVYNDFLEECLVKNFKNRPYMEEIVEHPFLSAIPENCYHLSQEVKTLAVDYSQLGKAERKKESALLSANTLKVLEGPVQHLLVQDLAALDTLTDSTVLEELKQRFETKKFQTFIGDILLTINPYEDCTIYGEDYHEKYKFKSRSENAPHVYSVADAAYQHALHHKDVQQIVLFGEKGSGKTSNYLHIIDHLLHLGRNLNFNADRITQAIKLIHSFTHASTPSNSNSTRCLLRSEITYGRCGNVSGAIFGVHLLEKLRVSCVDMPQANFHLLYYFYDHMAATAENREKYHLLPNRSHRYLRVPENDSSAAPRNDPETNISKFQEIESVLKEFEFNEEEVKTIYNILAAILVLGEIKFMGAATASAEIEDSGDLAEKVALLLNVDEKKFCWALTNYCLINKGVAVRKKQSCDEARSARDVLANNLYSRLVDYIVGFLNHKLSYGRVIFGDTYSVRVTDLFGFECSKQNMLTELLVNCLNEQLHYFYLQKTFTWETLDLSDDDINFVPFTFYDNKATLERILRKPDDLISLIDDASKKQQDGRYIIENLKNFEKSQIKAVNSAEFSITHYTGTVVYDAKEIPDKNRDFLPPEIIEVLRSSQNAIIRTIFTSKLNKMGNVVTSFGDETKTRITILSSSSSEDENKELSHQYSQRKRMRTIAATFRAVSLDLLKELSIGGSGGGTHFVRCIRSNLENSPWSFNNEIVRQQIKALVVTETAKERQNGYPCRITFPEFLKRYQFLAFDFDENVEITKDNCRLLLVRLKLEDWMIGNSKVFLKYFHEEYLSRSYETKVKKVVKIQSIIRSYLVKRRLLKSEINNAPTTPQSPEAETEEDQAARVIQKAFKELSVKKALRTEIYTDLDKETKEFIKYYCKKWRAKTIFQVLLQYRAARYQDLFSFSQQVHLYNQNVINCLQQIDVEVNLDAIDAKANCTSWIGEVKPTVLKIPFRLDDIPYYDTSYLCEPLTYTGNAVVEEEPWDSPFQWHNPDSVDIPTNNAPATLSELPYNRDPSDEIPILPPTPEPEIKQFEEEAPTPNPKRRINEVEEAMNVRNRLITDSNSVVDKDFEYIKPPPALKKRKVPEEVNPVAELKRLGRRESGKIEDDEPPFNFQKMLRKTNFKRDSLRRATGGVKNEEEHNFKNTLGVVVNKGEVEMINGNGNQDNISEEMFSGEILPGVLLEGFVVSV